MWREICAMQLGSVASCWANCRQPGLPQLPCGIRMWLQQQQGWSESGKGRGEKGSLSAGWGLVAFYFCINSNKHDNEMTTEMSDYIPHTHRHTHTLTHTHTAAIRK